MKKSIWLITLLGFIGVLRSQPARLIEEHTLLTNECKNIRGHAGRIVAEASEPVLNKDVAEAHLKEVLRYLRSMERRLKETKELLTPAQLKIVSPHYASLEKTCARLKEYTTKLEEEFARPRPEKGRIKSLATSLRNEMSVGKETHDRLKRDLGLK
jgi:hypothetical protein